MTDEEARELLQPYIEQAEHGASQGYTLARRQVEAFKHALAAMTDRAELVAALDYTTIQAVGYSRAGDAMIDSRRHMEGN